MFADILEIAVYVLMGAVVVVLVMGLGAMYSGGKNSKSNVFMRWRVGLQFAAIALLALLVFVVQK
ncbi:MAG: twin transmembrane helix small protein [Rhodospirillales bacterium]|nr:twin transmembrane helix small protein [Rhodospirillales bacterium]MDE0379128.1 twin transmembrane helix small protein [Rhodospirillales bacterium]